LTESSDAKKLVIDGNEVEFVPGEVVIAAAERAGTYIPRFCYHPRMRPVGMCRMCLVEVKGPRGFALQPACFVQATEGMEIVTNSDKVHKAQDGVIEFLLANHPLDCPVCDKGGECPLQDQALAHGSGETRFIEEKRHYAKPIPISDLILLDRERCIQCDRCTRFADEVAGQPLIDFVGRGADIEVATFPELPFTSYFSGNVAQICPVGALTTTPYRFKARPWDLEQVTTTCTSCGLGCREVLQSSQNQLTRVLGVDVDEVNHSWLCDKGRFSIYATNSEDRLTVPLLKKADSHVEISWAEAITKVTKALGGSDHSIAPQQIAALGGAHLSNEDYFAWTYLLTQVVGTTQIDPQLGDWLDESLLLPDRRATIESALSSRLLITAGGDLREDLPVLFLHVREAAKSGLALVDVNSIATAQSDVARRTIRYAPGEFEATIAALDVIELASQLGIEGVDQEGAGVTILCGRGDLGEHGGNRSQALMDFLLRYPKARMLPLARRGNTVGAARIASSMRGAEDRVDATEILRRCASGEVRTLVLLAADALSDFPDTELVARALEQVETVISLDGFETTTTSAAHLVLPVSAFGETEGSTTNIEGRVSVLAQKVVPAGLSRAPWVIAAEIAERLGAPWPYLSVGALWEALSRIVPEYRGISFEMISRAESGVLGVKLRTPVTIRNRRLDPVATPGIASVGRQAPIPARAVERDREGTTVLTAEEGERTSSELRVVKGISPARIDGDVALIITHQLYDSGVLQRHVEHLAHLGRSGQVAVSAATAQSCGVHEGDRVVLRRGDGRGAIELDLTLDEAVPEGCAHVENSSSLPVLQLVDSSYSMTRVVLERV
jgi:NADH-quinone oxidoreductase subunit G